MVAKCWLTDDSLLCPPSSQSILSSCWWKSMVTLKYLETKSECWRSVLKFFITINGIFNLHIFEVSMSKHHLQKDITIPTSNSGCNISAVRRTHAALEPWTHLWSFTRPTLAYIWSIQAVTLHPNTGDTTVNFHKVFFCCKMHCKYTILCMTMIRPQN